MQETIWRNDRWRGNLLERLAVRSALTIRDLSLFWADLFGIGNYSYNDLPHGLSVGRMLSISVQSELLEARFVNFHASTCVYVFLGLP